MYPFSSLIVIVLNILAVFKVHGAGMFGKKKDDMFALSKRAPFLMRFCVIILIAMSFSGALLWLSGARELFLSPTAEVIVVNHNYAEAVLREAK